MGWLGKYHQIFYQPIFWAHCRKYDSFVSVFFGLQFSNTGDICADDQLLALPENEECMPNNSDDAAFYFDCGFGRHAFSIFQCAYGTIRKNPFGNAENFRHFYIWSGVWQGFGWGSIIYVAALSAVDPNLHEAATIDGASRFQRVLHIDFLTILPTIVIMLILNTGSIMSIGFEKVYLMQNPLNLSTSEVISTYVYKVGLSSEGSVDFSYSTAIGLFNSIVNMIFIVVVNAIAGRVSENSLW